MDKRFKPQNWFDVSPDDEIPSSLEGWWRTVIQMFQITFAPEIRRRIASAAISDSDFIWGLQMIQPYEGGQTVRINEQVRGLSYVRAPRPVQKGEAVRLGDFEHMETFDLDVDELDCGHFTIFYTGRSWTGAFDFRSGRAKARGHLISAREFHSAACLCAGEGLANAAADNLFSAAELVAKSHLILHRSKSAKAKSHGSISAALNKWGKLGNVPAEFLRTYNKFSGARADARYKPERKVALPSEEELGVVLSELNQLEEAVVQKCAKPD